MQGPPVEVLKAELTKARAAAKQPAVEVDVDQCRKFIARSEVDQRVGHTACRGVALERPEVVGSAVPSPHRCHFRIPRHRYVTSADGEYGASRTRCVGARVALGEAGGH